MLRWRFVLSGRVQGVGLRYSSAQVARQLGLSGWVKNIDDKVVLEVEGFEEALEKMEKWLKKGKWFAKITNLDKIVLALEHDNGFNIRLK